ncbi:slo-interacting protein 1 isoform X1 [Rhagoletis pomonella]|uniref:slo-interacting protein 1 isoform X1 n=1 Tax=Rhagoletis pomonella TaxID=28610 RepID=UPI00177CF57A|nr:slo-interacting protein 1 isoform X1 [Rhagoletis pomonella]
MAEINFLVFKINGTDISQMPEDKVVQMFLTAGEPLLVEMQRKSSITPNCSALETTANSDYSEKDCKDVNAKMAGMAIATTLKPKTGESVKFDADLTSTVKLVVAIKTSEATATIESASRDSKSTQTDNNYFIYDNSKDRAEHYIEHEHNLLEHCLAPEIDIEEITLRKSDSNERLGLIVCYNGCANNGALSNSDDNDACTEVYISGIQPDSVAGRDGRLRQGDQILQINGKYIKNKEETELLIAENNNAVTLLVSRYLFTDEDDFNDPLLADLEVDEEDDVEEEEFYVESNITYENCLLQNEPANELEKALALHSERKPTKLQIPAIENQLPTTAAVANVDTITSPSSSVQICADIVECPEQKVLLVSSQPTTATRNDKALNQLQNQQPQKQNRTTHKNIAKKNLRSHKAEQSSRTLLSPFDSVKNGPSEQHINYDTEHIYETIPEDSESEPFYCSPYESSTYVTAFGSCSSTTTDSPQLQLQKMNVAKWLDVCVNPTNISQLNAISASARGTSAGNRKQFHNDTNEMEIRKKSNTVRSTLTTITNGSSSSGGSGNSGGSNIVDVSQNEERDSSSAYNTGGSNNSTIPLRSVLNQSGKCDSMLDDSKSLKSQLPKDKTSSILSKTGCDALSQLSQTIRSNIESSADVRTNPSNFCCPQFVAPNLSQYHFVSSQEVRTGIRQTMAVTTRVDEVNHKSLAKEDTMVWKVKRRQDGTRYIVRRPARNRCLLRDRSIRINTEHVRNRHMSTTTEEDNISEVKVGRYWSKEERRKHIERARERKQQHQLQKQQITDDNNLSKVFVKDQSSLKLVQQKKTGLIPQRTNQNRFAEHSGNQTQQPNITTPLQQHYQLQFNSSRIQHQKQARCDSNATTCAPNVSFNEKQSISPKELALETGETETCRISEIGAVSSKSNCPVFPSSLVVTGSQTAVVVTNTSTFPAAVEKSELQNCISITTI